MANENIAKGCITVPAKYDTSEKIQEYCKKKGINFIFERWIFKAGQGAKK